MIARVLIGGAVITAASRAHSEPLRLRADALTTARSPAGLLVLDTDAMPNENLSAEAVVWVAGQRDARSSELDEGATGDVLVAAVRARTANGRASAQLGRFVASLGALRATHVDGADARVRLPARVDAEAIFGVPVEPGLAMSHGWDWYAAGRLSRRLGEWGSAGIAYAQRRDDGQVVSEELAGDAGVALSKRSDVGVRAAFDLATSGLAELAVTTSYRRNDVRSELYALHRDASHLLPATSLFSVIGDVPSQRAGAVVTWRAAPRLDVIGEAAARRTDQMGLDIVGRARLRLDERGTSSLTGELRRSGIADDAWTGARCAARLGLPRGLSASWELELVVPDAPHGRGRVWPWGLAAIGWDHKAWQAALAVEASASPEYRHRVDVIAQLARRWSLR